MTKTTKVTKKKDNLPAVVDFGIGKEYVSGIDKNDITIPRMLLVQKSSDMEEWKLLKPAEVPRPGMFYNPASGETYSSFKALVIHHFVQVYTLKEVKKGTSTRFEIDKFSSDGIHWNEGGAVIQPNEFDWPKDGSKAGVALKRFNYVIIPEGDDMPCIIQFKATSAKHAKKLNYNLLRLRPMWSTYCNFTAIEETNKDSGEKYFVMNGSAILNDPLTDQKLADDCLTIYKSFKGKTIKIESDDADSDDNEEVKY